MNDDYEDDDTLDAITCEDELTRAEIKRGLWDGTWRVHARDAQGRTWFVPTGQPPIPEPDDDLEADSLPTTIKATPPVEEPRMDVRGCKWHNDLHAAGELESDHFPTIRFSSEHEAIIEGEFLD